MRLSRDPAPLRYRVCLSILLVLLVLFVFLVPVQELAEAHVKPALDDIHEALELLRRQAEALLEASLRLIIDLLPYLLEPTRDRRLILAKQWRHLGRRQPIDVVEP